MEWLLLGVIILFVLLILISAGVKIVQQYELGVVFRFGRLVGTKKPGIRVIIPFIDRMRKIDTRVLTMDVPSQEVLTRDNVTTKVNAVVFLRVIDPERAVIEVYDYRMATYQFAQTTLRSVLGQHDLDALLTQRDKLNQTLRRIIDEATEPWGVKVSAVEIKDVELPSGMQRAMAAQAEAERERRAKVIHADGEYQAAEKLAQAAEVLATQPAALQLRYLQTLTTIATERTNTVVFPLPLDMLAAFTPTTRSTLAQRSKE
ncbi:MAG: slipin family protein [Chloroflexi bacterium]|nr:MAG: slipin family protein [Chloroflexota bacterium]